MLNYLDQFDGQADLMVQTHKLQMAWPHHANAHPVLSISWPGQAICSSHMHHQMHLVHGDIQGKASCPVHNSSLYRVGPTPPSGTG